VTVLLAGGLALRIVTQAAYHPALIYIDTLKYLLGEYPGSDPLGYRLLLKIILPVGGLGTVELVQHLVGLAAAVLLYTVLLRRGSRRWLAALAVAPVLLDAYQLRMEATIMPDAWFGAMIVAGLALLLWRPAVTVPFAVAAGLILGSSATIRQVGELLVLPAVLFVLVSGGGWRRVATVSVALAAAFALPIVGYCGVSLAGTGHFWLSRGQVSTGRMAAAADCATLRVPAAVRALCPTPAEQAQGPDWLEHSGQSPLHRAPVPAGANRAALIAALSSAVEHEQPARVAYSVARDAVRLFALTRTGIPGSTPIARWQFQAGYPVYPPAVTVGPGNTIILRVQRRLFGPFIPSPLSPAYGGPAQVDRPLAAFLRSYQLDGGYTPGPLLALCALLGVAGSALALTRHPRQPGPPGTRTVESPGPETVTPGTSRPRTVTRDTSRPGTVTRDASRPGTVTRDTSRPGTVTPDTSRREVRSSDAPGRQLALACLLWTSCAAIVLLVPDVLEFSWRYQLPAMITLPPAGVLGLGAVVAQRRARRPA
jgi:hypothetical protein